MKKRKQIALNKLFNFCIILGFILVLASYDLLKASEFAWGLGIGLAALLLIVLPAIFTPYCYSFDDEGISLCYLFLPVERYLWKDVYAIEVEDIGEGGKKSLLVFFLYESVFSIHGNTAGECRFYMKGHIRKTFRTKYLLNKYWDGTITGYLFEDTKKRIQKRKAKKQKQIKIHLTDEIVPMEREIRAEAREWLKPLIEQAKQQDLEIKVKYYYVTNDFEELSSRPDEGYVYTLIAEIAHPNETDEDRIFVVSADLLYVRLGKTAYRGVKNKYAKEQLEFFILDELDEIKKNGM